MPFGAAFQIASGRRSIQKHKPKTISTSGFKKKRTATSMWGVKARKDAQDRMIREVEGGLRSSLMRDIEGVPPRDNEVDRRRNEVDRRLVAQSALEAAIRGMLRVQSVRPSFVE